MEPQFANRKEAGQELAKRLGPIDAQTHVIFALPRGGVPVAAEIARVTGAPLDLLLVRKIGVPGHEELAVGAIVDGAAPVIAVNQKVAAQYGLTDADIETMSQKGLAEIERRRGLYFKNISPQNVEGKIAIVVDDGIATGATVKAALLALAKRKPKRIILAVPIAPADTLSDLAAYADQIICLQTPFPFYAVGAHYRDFPQVDDAAVIAALAETAAQSQKTQPSKK